MINSKILQKLIDKIDDTSEIIQIESNRKTMPLIALYKKQCKDTFNKLLQSDERRLQIAIKACKSKNIVLKKENEMITASLI